ncbi:MAG: DNA gyrase inhibitor YacG [Gammaproteobacteria bacterium]|nr:DNA gyrase inhibitor YacG [Gammaproteobacteria bacterium]
MKTSVKCPTCQKQVVWDKALSPWRPFCSERCKLIDLGEWAAESHRIKGESIMPDNMDDIE